MPRLPLYFDRDGNAISPEAWAALIEDDVTQASSSGEPEYRRVGADEVDGLWVSTVWTGIDVSFALGRHGAPMIYETMLFAGDDAHPLHNAMTRYTNEFDAYEGHQRTVADLRAGRAPWFLLGDLEHARKGEDD